MTDRPDFAEIARRRALDFYGEHAFDETDLGFYERLMIEGYAQGMIDAAAKIQGALRLGKINPVEPAP